jgi:hypothetical protein
LLLLLVLLLLSSGGCSHTKNICAAEKKVDAATNARNSTLGCRAVAAGVAAAVELLARVLGSGFIRQKLGWLWWWLWRWCFLLPSWIQKKAKRAVRSGSARWKGIAFWFHRGKEKPCNVNPFEVP